MKQFWLWLKYLNHNVIFINRFAGYHSLVPSFLNRIFRNCNSIIILGGSDSNAFPSINYGNYTNKLYGKATAWSIKYATHLFPVSKFLISAINTYNPEDPKQQGVKAFVKDFKTPYTEIHNGFDYNKFNFNQNLTRIPKSFVTIAGGANQEKKQKLKGIDLIIKAAKQLPENSFTVIGSDFNHPELPSNLNFIPFIENSKLPNFLGRYEYYFQISISEGFPNALCEAMLCGCIPIVSNVGIMPEIISNTGYILKNRNVQELITVLNSSTYNVQKSINARKRIIKQYSIEARSVKLLESIELVTNNDNI